MRIALDRRADRAGRLPLARQIQLHIERLIGQRLLGAGAKLPATRELARDLGVNRTTVALAYDELVAGGWARAHVGQGTFVADQVPAAEAPRAAAPRFDWTGFLSKSAQVIAADARRRQDWSRGPRPAPGLISFAGGMPDSGLFPTDAFRRVLNRVIREEGRELLQYYPARGYPPLREFLAGYLLRFGLEARAEEILIVNGSQQGFDLIARTLLDPGDFVAIEQPSYPRAMQVFRAFGAQLLPVPMVSGGLDAEPSSALLERQSPKLVYCQPSAHNPTGLTMAGARAAAAPGGGGAPPAPDRGGRLRWHALLRRTASGAAEGARPHGARRLHRDLLEDPVPGIAPRLDRGGARAGRSARDGQGPVGHPHEPAHPGRGVSLLSPAPARSPPGARAARVRATAQCAARLPRAPDAARASSGRRRKAASRCSSRCPSA